MLASACGAPPSGVVFSENFDMGAARWTLGTGFTVETASGSDLWLRAQYDESCGDQTYNFAYVTTPFDFAGARSVSISIGGQGSYGTGDSTGLAWTTEVPSPTTTWNEVAPIVPRRGAYTTGTATLPAAALQPGVYLGVYFRNVCVRGSVGVDVGYDDFQVVVTR